MSIDVKPAGKNQTIGAGSTISLSSEAGAWATLRRGLQLSPQIAKGLWLTLLLAIGAAAGRVVVPMTVQRVIDDGILAAGGPNLYQILRFSGFALAALVVAGLCSAAVNFRLVSRTEAGLAQLRVQVFRHIHDLSALTQNTERRGALVSRVTSDIDTITQFMQWGGIMLVVATLQLLVASVLMLVFSIPLTLVVWACFIPLVLMFRSTGPRVREAFGKAREQTGQLLGAVSEAVVGAETVRAYGAGPRTFSKIDRAINAVRIAQGKAQVMVATTFTAGSLTSNLALAIVVVVGTLLGLRGNLTAGQVVAFLFLVQLFTGPVQLATEILNEFQNALAGWRRVIAVVETPIDVPDPPHPVPFPTSSVLSSLRAARSKPAPSVEALETTDPLTVIPRTAASGSTGSVAESSPVIVGRSSDAQCSPVITGRSSDAESSQVTAGNPSVVADQPSVIAGSTRNLGGGQLTFADVSYAYPDGPWVLTDVNLVLPPCQKVAIVGHTGSGKTTLAKLACRLMDPTEGAVVLDGVDLREASLTQLRRRVVLVPQEGFLFEGTIASNVAYASRTPITDQEITDSFVRLGLGDWLAELPDGVQTEVGQRGESLSAGERQLVALVRASVAEPEVLVLDEATSAVDPATEVRIARALELLTSGRTTLTIAHRLSTAEAADLVVVVDKGKVVEVGTAAELIANNREFAEMHRAWQSQISS